MLNAFSVDVEDYFQVLAFEPDRQCTVQGASHLDLLSHPAVYDQLRRWLA